MKLSKGQIVRSVFLSITGNTTSIASFVCKDKEITAANIDPDRFVSHVKTMYNVKTGTISRYLRLFKAAEKNYQSYQPVAPVTTNIN